MSEQLLPDGAVNASSPWLTKDEITLLMSPKALQSQIKALGGVQGVARSLQTCTMNGITGSDRDFESRRERYGNN